MSSHIRRSQACPARTVPGGGRSGRKAERTAPAAALREAFDVGAAGLEEGRWCCWHQLVYWRRSSS